MSFLLSSSLPTLGTSIPLAVWNAHLTGILLAFFSARSYLPFFFHHTAILSTNTCFFQTSHMEYIWKRTPILWCAEERSKRPHSQSWQLVADANWKFSWGCCPKVSVLLHMALSRLPCCSSWGPSRRVQRGQALRWCSIAANVKPIFLIEQSDMSCLVQKCIIPGQLQEKNTVW